MQILFSVIILALNTLVSIQGSPVYHHSLTNKYDLDDNKFSSCILITAIADDFLLIKELKEHDIELITYKFPDHYQFRESDIPRVDQPILVTEKDFVKLNLFVIKMFIF